MGKAASMIPRLVDGLSMLTIAKGIVEEGIRVENQGLQVIFWRLTSPYNPTCAPFTPINLST